MTAQGIAAIISLRYGVKPSAIFAAKKWPELKTPRRMAWRLARRDGWTYARIGREFERDHTTIIHGLRGLGW